MNELFPDQLDRFYVHTEASQHVIHHLERPRCHPLLVLGGPGTGKTALLHHLSMHFESAGHLVLLLSLRTIRSLEELVPQLIARLIDSSPRRDTMLSLRKAYNTVSLADASTAMTRVLESVCQELVSGQRIFIWLDGLNEVMPNDVELFGQRLIEWIEEVSTEHGSIVLTSRPMSFIRSAYERRHLTTIQLGNWTVSELTEMVERRVRSQNLKFPQRLIKEAIDASGGSPLLVMRILEHAAETGQWPRDTPYAVQYSAAAVSFSLSSFESLWGNREEFWSILLTCWAARRIQPDQLEHAIYAVTDQVSRTRIAAWINKAEAREFIKRDGNNMVVQEVLDNAVVHELLPVGIDLDRLFFGDEAAERDKLLATSFDEPKDIHEILNGFKTIVLGDRGAGKSAIYQSLIQRAGDAQANGTIIAASKNSSEFLSKMGSATNPTAERFKAIWLLYVASFAAREMQSRVDTTTVSGKCYRDDCHRLLRSLGQIDDIKAPSLMSRLASPLRAFLPEKVSFTVGPVKIEQAFSNAEKSSSNAVDINDFLHRTATVLEQKELRLVIVFDQIDEAHKYQKSQEQLVQGLLMAESKLAQTLSIRLVVLLRTDLYEIYHIEEKNKFVSRTAQLTWKPPQLLQQLLLRAYSNAQLKHIAERIAGMSIDQHSRELIQMRLLFPAEIERKEFWHWLMDGLTTGNKRVSPRQIVLFMNLLKEEAKGGGDARRIPLYSESQVLAALIELSRLSYNEVIDDFKVATVLVQNCKAQNLDRIKFTDVARLSDPDQGTPAAQVDQLRRLGFFEHAVGEDEGELVSELQVAALYRRFWT